MQIPAATLLPSRKHADVVFLLFFSIQHLVLKDIKNAEIKTFLPIPVRVVVNARQSKKLSL